MTDKTKQEYRTNCHAPKQRKLQNGNWLVTACLRVAQVIRESLQFICCEVVVISQHKPQGTAHDGLSQAA